MSKVNFPRCLNEATIVRLKSGGPIMTTEGPRMDNYVDVVWFDGLLVRRDAFHIDALVQIADEIKTLEAMNRVKAQDHA